MIHNPLQVGADRRDVKFLKTGKLKDSMYPHAMIQGEKEYQKDNRYDQVYDKRCSFKTIQHVFCNWYR